MAQQKKMFAIVFRDRECQIPSMNEILFNSFSFENLIQNNNISYYSTFDRSQVNVFLLFHAGARCDSYIIKLDYNYKAKLK